MSNKYLILLLLFGCNESDKFLVEDNAKQHARITELAFQVDWYRTRNQELEDKVRELGEANVKMSEKLRDSENGCSCNCSYLEMQIRRGEEDLREREYSLLKCEEEVSRKPDCECKCGCDDPSYCLNSICGENSGCALICNNCN